MLQRLNAMKKDYLRILESFLYYAKRIDEHHQILNLNKSQPKSFQRSSQKGSFYRNLSKPSELYHLKLFGGNRVS